MKNNQKYTLWIEAEVWPPDEWDVADSNTDVILTWEDKSRWVATFYSYKNIQTLTEKDRRTGESMSGGYFWGSDMILVENTSREHIEKVIAELIREGIFEVVFSAIPLEEDEG
jgi:hypothetical protein